MTPLEILLKATSDRLQSGEISSALAAAKSAAPYMGLTAEQIIDALTAGRTVSELLAEVDAKLRAAR